MAESPQIAKALLDVEAERRSALDSWPLTCDAAGQSRGRVRRKYAADGEGHALAHVRKSVGDSYRRLEQRLRLRGVDFGCRTVGGLVAKGH